MTDVPYMHPGAASVSGKRYELHAQLHSVKSKTVCCLGHVSPEVSVLHVGENGLKKLVGWADSFNANGNLRFDTVHR